MDSIMGKNSQRDKGPNCQRHAFPLLFQKAKSKPSALPEKWYGFQCIATSFDPSRQLDTDELGNLLHKFLENKFSPNPEPSDFSRSKLRIFVVLT
jgi:hypothetical protein